MRKTMLDELAQPVAHPHTEVEMMYIADYLKSKGYSLEKLAELPEATAKALMQEASQFASLHLAEVEMGAAFVGALHQDATTKAVSAVSTATEQ
ncbi:MAG: hypothetical protein DYG89_02955 [Caldilinea sp. CFX5]|nr:hypothetical protein [Caldilinea sp. CFX5]